MTVRFILRLFVVSRSTLDFQPIRRSFPTEPIGSDITLDIRLAFSSRFRIATDRLARFVSFSARSGWKREPRLFAG